ncbi:MAG: transcriptional repressor LexA [bacterium]|nr:transcriptional repressor LexA [bacterium]
MIKNITPKQKKVLEIIYNNIESTGFPPTLADLKNELDVVSNQAVLNYLDALTVKGYIVRSEGQARGITILPLGYKILNKDQLAPVVGGTAAGPFIETLEETSFTWMPLPGQIVKDEKINQSNEQLFVVKVYGDSMTNAGIDNGDMLLVKKAKEFKSGDIVLARTDQGTTVKRFVADGGKRYLKPENPNYKNIIIIPGEVFFDGKVILNLSKVK